MPTTPIASFNLPNDTWEDRTVFHYVIHDQGMKDMAPLLSARSKSVELTRTSVQLSRLEPLPDGFGSQADFHQQMMTQMVPGTKLASQEILNHEKFGECTCLEFLISHSGDRVRQTVVLVAGLNCKLVFTCDDRLQDRMKQTMIEIFHSLDKVD